MKLFDRYRIVRAKVTQTGMRTTAGDHRTTLHIELSNGDVVTVCLDEAENGQVFASAIPPAKKEKP